MMMGRDLSTFSSNLDFFAQARKALSDLSPFEAEESRARVSTLPVSFSLFLSKCSETRGRRHKKSHSDSAVGSHGPRNIWAETEDYFRPVALSDIEFLCSRSEGKNFRSSFEIPSLPSGNCPVKACRDVLEVGNEQQEAQEMEIDVQNLTEVVPTSPHEIDSPKDEQLSESFEAGLEWLLGSKHKVLLTSERPSKKRKLLGEDAGLEKLFFVDPAQGGDATASICHVCCSGNSGEKLNCLLSCSSCKVSVHQKCYGVLEAPKGEWFCSWCRRNDSGKVERPCMLCPRDGGALKPVGGNSGRSGEFAHLVCCQWMPEVYVENTETMEPIVNLEGIKDTRRKLVCYLCKVKYGACIRCSHGTCRTSFHPICAREAKHRMEIFGKLGCDNVELRAFCSKHSASQDTTAAQSSHTLVPVTVTGDLLIPKHLSVTLPLSRLHKLKVEYKSRDKIPDDDCNKVGKNETPLEGDMPMLESSAPKPECGDRSESVYMGIHDVAALHKMADLDPANSLNIVLILKKLVDQGKANLTEVAAEIDVSSDSLVDALKGDHTSFPCEWRPRIIKWLQRSAHVATPVLQRSDDPTNPVKLLPSMRKMKGNVKVLRDAKTVVCSSGETISQQNDASGKLVDAISENPVVLNEDLRGDSGIETKYLEQDGFSEGTPALEKMVKSEGVQMVHTSPWDQSSKNEGNSRPQHSAEKVFNQPDEADGALPNVFTNANGEDTNMMNGQSASSSYIHPFINKRLQTQNCLVVKQRSTIPPECDGQMDKEKETTCYPDSVCCNDLSSWHHFADTDVKDFVARGLGEQLAKAKKMGVLELAPDDEVEGEIIYLQNRLLDHAIASKHRSEDLIFRVVTNIPHELDALRKQRWDTVLMNQFLCEVKEAKKQGRKERRRKEAQAVLAAATAAAAASSRISSFRKDGIEEIDVVHHQQNLPKVNSGRGRPGSYSQSIPRPKETYSKLLATKVSSDQSESSSDFSKGNSRSCDICSRGETMLNRILVCCNCKVAVHLGCYHSLKDSIGPWYCEPCEELLLQSRSPRVPAVNAREKSCGLCGGITGAFRKSNDEQWVHAFCAEWVLESNFKRGQPSRVEGMETLLKERDVCCLCHRKVGVCIKCNFGNCQSTFHPACAKNAGLYMSIKTVGGKILHKAYCEKHSLDQRDKAEIQQHGTEELRRIKQIRVELEKLRLLCERIIKREKLKKELVLCSHDMLASRRDFVAFSILVRSFFPGPDVSSESVTTSLKSDHEDNKSCSETLQRSDDITVDSSVSGKRRVGFAKQMDVDRKTDDSSTSQRAYTRKSTDRISSSGKQLLHRPASIISRSSGDLGENRFKSRKHTETFQKELVMTSDQASMQNQRLPKGFAYVPIGCLSKDKQQPDG